MNKYSTVCEAIDLIRKDPKVGRGSCSSIDECYTDSELREMVDCMYDELSERWKSDYRAPKAILNKVLRLERLRNEVQSRGF